MFAWLLAVFVSAVTTALFVLILSLFAKRENEDPLRQHRAFKVAIERENTVEARLIDSDTKLIRERHRAEQILYICHYKYKVNGHIYTRKVIADEPLKTITFYYVSKPSHAAPQGKIDTFEIPWALVAVIIFAVAFLIASAFAAGVIHF